MPCGIRSCLSAFRMSVASPVRQQQPSSHNFITNTAPTDQSSAQPSLPASLEKKMSLDSSDPNGDAAKTNGDSSIDSGVVNPPGYKFPDQRLKTTMEDSTKTPLVLVACGSFSPITYLHLRMFEMVADFAKFNTEYEVIGGFLSPVADAYKKKGLASADHRLRMCQLATDQDPSSTLMVDSWEASFEEYTRTALVLDHFEYEINQKRQGAATKDGQRKKVRIALLAGADLIGTMSTPGVWSQADLDHILGRYGAFIIERSGTDIDEALSSLQNWKDNITVIKQLIQNDVSSTKIRSFLDKKMSVNYLIPAPVITYIQEYGLYKGVSLHERQDSGNQTPPKEGTNSPVQPQAID